MLSKVFFANMELIVHVFLFEKAMLGAQLVQSTIIAGNNNCRSIWELFVLGINKRIGNNLYLQPPPV